MRSMRSHTPRACSRSTIHYTLYTTHYTLRM